VLAVGLCTTIPSMTYCSQLSTDQQQTRNGSSDSLTTAQPFTYRILLVTSMALCIINFQYTSIIVLPYVKESVAGSYGDSPCC
jgi:hypothetical protein